MARYDHKTIEKKWQEVWETSQANAAFEDPAKKKFYALDMFPYPSGDGLHMGHPLSYTATDIIARKRRMEGWNVLHPMGFDAFGLPAENYAIKKGTHPRITTLRNIDNFRRQLKSLGFSYDWNREVVTCDPAYYRWTQWMFLLLYKNGLAYKKKASVNWCESCQTVLANEQVVDDACERCKNRVIQKDLAQWFFKVTDYADRLLDGLEKLDWPDKIKAMQTNWIGRSEGGQIVFRGLAMSDDMNSREESFDSNVREKEFDVTVFTTRPDTVFGVSYVVLAPEHPLVLEIVSPEQRGEVMAYIEAARGKSELERTGTQEDKTGVSLGVCARHPFTGKDVPLWVADYVVGNYGTGAVMGVPAHDDRDFAFAKKYRLPITHVILPAAGTAGANPDAAYTEAGFMANSGEFDGLTSDEGKQRIMDALAQKGLGGRHIQYHLRDWLISRQRYWGAPIPIIYCDKCGEVPVPEEDLPVLLPDDVDFRPTGESPLARSKSFHDVLCPNCRGKARRESDTMDTFVDSSWYFLRYCSSHDGDRPFSSHAVEYWCPVDLYVGGAEHAVLHLMYARFMTKVLFDKGYLPSDEPFLALRNQGMILGEDGQKMSKSRGNVINPDSVVEEHGADTLRLYEMFMGEFADSKPWDTKSIIGVRRFLDRVWMSVHDVVHQDLDSTPEEPVRQLHRTIRKVSADVEAFKFNTAISSMMILLNEWGRLGGGDRKFAGTFVQLLAPFAPHLAEELWHVLGNTQSVFAQKWPVCDDKLAFQDEIEMIVQVNGKLRDKFTVPAGLGDEDAKARALGSAKVQAAIKDKKILKVVAVRGKLVNIAVES